MSDSNSPINSISAGGLTGTSEPANTFEFLVSPTVASDFNTARLRLIPVACWRIDNIRFAFDSSFVTPGMAKEIQHLRELREEHQKDDVPAGGAAVFPPLSIFGHTDPVGNDVYNKALGGRRAAAIYGLLVRNTKIWEDLFSNTGAFTTPAVGDKWGNASLQTMADTTGLPASTSRKELFSAYMDFICTPRGADGSQLLDAAGDPVPPLQLSPTADFLAQKTDPFGKGDYQGCGEFNPVMIFSQQESDGFGDSSENTTRDSENAQNRRVMALLFRPGSRIDPAKWPCPLAKEGTAKCIKRFFSDGEARRSTRLPDQRREFAKTKDTFACRFYDRLSSSSPCEAPAGDGLLFMQCFDGDGTGVLKGRKYLIRGNGSPAILFKGVLDNTGTLRHELVPNGDYVLSVQGCSQTSPMAVLDISEQIPQIRMLPNGRLGIRAVTPEGVPIPNATVQVDGLGQGLTDEDGLAYFGTVDDGVFSFQVAKPGFRPVNAPVQNAQAIRAGNTVTGGSEGAATGSAVVNQTRTDTTVKLTQDNKPVLSRVLQIDARQVGTSGVKDRTKKLPLGIPSKLASSKTPNPDLVANPPVVLVRGSHPILLKAITDPPGQLVSWQVIPNQSAGTAPGIDPKQTFGDFEAQVSTDTTGSFAVQAQLNGTLVTWNFVLVGVDVDPNSVIKIQENGLQDFNLSIAGGAQNSGLLSTETFDNTVLTAVASGKFEFGKHPWASEVRITLKGGGPAGDLGCDQVVVQILQNMVADTTAGEYKSQIAFSDLANPARLLDTQAGSPVGYDGPVVGAAVSPETKLPTAQSPFLQSNGMFQLTKNDPTSRVIRVGDSPATGFRTNPSGEPLLRIRGALEFRTVVASFSKQSKDSIVAHADAVWRVDYSGDVTVDKTVGKWQRTGAKVIGVQGWQPIRSSSGVNGTDAGNALVEIFPPRASDLTSNEKKIIPKP